MKTYIQTLTLFAATACLPLEAQVPTPAADQPRLAAPPEATTPAAVVQVDPAQPPSAFGAGGFGGGGGGSIATALPPVPSGGYGYSVNRTLARPAPATIVAFGGVDQTNQDNLSEDLRVMSYLMEKNLGRAFGNLPTYKMGILMQFTDGSRPVRSLYLEGYGAVFFLNVNFPLAGTPSGKEGQAQSTKNTEWDEARRNLNGNPNEEQVEWYQYQPNDPFAQGSAFNPEQVETLKDELIRTLKNAANVRGLASDDYVAISVEGASAQGRGGAAAGAGEFGAQRRALYGRYGITTAGGEPAARTASFISLRTRKSDIEAFASGKLKFDEFKKKVVVSSRLGVARGEGGPETQTIPGAEVLSK